MRAFSTLLFVLAAVVSGVAVLAYASLTSIACGYAPNASGCRGAPWQLNSDDRFWLVQLPALIVAALIGCAILIRRRLR